MWIVPLEGDSIIGAGLFDGRRLDVDRSLTQCAGHIVLAYVDNQSLVNAMRVRGYQNFRPCSLTLRAVFSSWWG